jgi:hypothetical protein
MRRGLIGWSSVVLLLAACSVNVSLDGKQCAPTAPQCLAGYHCEDGLCVRGSDADAGPLLPTIVAASWARFDGVVRPELNDLTWNAGDLLIIGYAERSGSKVNQPFTWCLVGDAGATLRNAIQQTDATRARSSVYLWAWRASDAGSGTVAITADEPQFSLLAVWVVRNATTVLPSETLFLDTLTSRAYTTQDPEGPAPTPRRDLSLALTLDAGTRPTAGSLVLAMSTTFFQHWTMQGSLGSERTPLPGTVIDATVAADSYLARAFALHAEPRPDGGDVVLGTTSTLDPQVYGNIIGLEVR